MYTSEIDQDTGLIIDKPMIVTGQLTDEMDVNLSSRKIRVTYQMGQYVQAHTGGTNSVEKERTSDALYIGRTDNGKHGHIVYKLKTKRIVTCNKINIIPINQDTIDRINELGKVDHQPDNIVITDKSGNVTILDVDEED